MTLEMGVPTGRCQREGRGIEHSTTTNGRIPAFQIPDICFIMHASILKWFANSPRPDDNTGVSQETVFYQREIQPKHQTFPQSQYLPAYAALAFSALGVYGGGASGSRSRRTPRSLESVGKGAAGGRCAYTSSLATPGLSSYCSFLTLSDCFSRLM